MQSRGRKQSLTVFASRVVRYTQRPSSTPRPPRFLPQFMDASSRRGDNDRARPSSTLDRVRSRQRRHPPLWITGRYSPGDRPCWFPKLHEPLGAQLGETFEHPMTGFHVASVQSIAPLSLTKLEPVLEPVAGELQRLTVFGHGSNDTFSEAPPWRDASISRHPSAAAPRPASPASPALSAESDTICPPRSPR